MKRSRGGESEEETGEEEEEPDLDAIVDEPLEGGEGADHDDPGPQAAPQAGHAQLLVGRPDAAPLHLVEQGQGGQEGALGWSNSGIISLASNLFS